VATMGKLNGGGKVLELIEKFGKVEKNHPQPNLPKIFLFPPPPKTKFYLNDLAICAKGEKQKGKIDGDQIVMNKQKGLFSCSTCFYHALQVETQRLFSGCS